MIPGADTANRVASVVISEGRWPERNEATPNTTNVVATSTSETATA
ncbi:MAG TPA: hypothetical protein VN894_00755 [Polyangiaceae bacterium]|nr:hypothetical protein [Polyangiaceae bacterium]